MAEVVFEFVLKNLADFIVKEAQFLGEVGRKAERVQRELIRIKCYLKDADSKKKGDERVQNWLNELRDVAYRIADATDTYFLPVEDHDQKEASSFLKKLKKVCKKPMKLSNLHKLGSELDEIQNLLGEICESRLRYGIQDLPLEDKNKGEAVRMPLRRATYSDVDETEVVGMQDDMKKILELLCTKKTLRRAVVTIVGAGGLGKTTLACMVYRSAQADFDYHIMLSISQQFSLTDLLSKMICKYNNSVPKDRDVDYYVGELKSFLSSKRYLVILDDVWTGDLWNQLKELLPDDKNGSRVLMTSRFIEVARFADSQMPPYELNFLDNRESLDLLLKKALPYEVCPNDLLELAHKLSKKCKGLPLGLIVLGGILSTKELSYPAWGRVLQTMNWHSDGNGCMQILAMSYEDMPYYLKACFQYLASFPEDYVISAKCLIRMWVAEGFIPLEGTTTIETLVEDCLEELAKRSMVQVLSRSAYGLIKHIKVHDILRELAMHEAEHENFVTVFSEALDDKKPNNKIRRVSLQAVRGKNSQFLEYVGPNTRSLLMFDAISLQAQGETSEFLKYEGPNYSLFDVRSNKISLNCSNFRLLKVLKIVRTKCELKSLGELIHLKYLGLRGCNILSSCSFRGMRSLLTLDVRGSEFWQPCDDIWSIGTLMHVLDTKYHATFLRKQLPNATLSNLQTLKWVTHERALDAKFPNLRKLGIINNTNEWVSIINLLQSLPFLVSLGINANNSSPEINADNIYIPMEVIYPKALPNYQNLQSLHLCGMWPKNVKVEASLFPPHLVKLTIRCACLKQNPMSELGKLNSLNKLILGYRGWEGPIICLKGFPALQHLEMYGDTKKDLTVAQGVMPKLTYVKVCPLLMVHLPFELQHVQVLN